MVIALTVGASIYAYGILDCTKDGDCPNNLACDIKKKQCVTKANGIYECYTWTADTYSGYLIDCTECDIVLLKTRSYLATPSTCIK